MAAKFVLPKGNQVIGWNSWARLKEDGNCFLKRANEHSFVSGHSN